MSIGCREAESLLAGCNICPDGDGLAGDRGVGANHSRYSVANG